MTTVSHNKHNKQGKLHVIKPKWDERTNSVRLRTQQTTTKQDDLGGEMSKIKDINQ